MVGNARENVEPRNCPQSGMRKCLHGLYRRHVFRCNEIVDCAILKKMNMTARELLSRRASDKELRELEKQEWRDREEFARRIEELESEGEAAKKTMARLEGIFPG